VDIKLRYGNGGGSKNKYRGNLSEKGKISSLVEQGEISPAKALRMLKSGNGKADTGGNDSSASRKTNGVNKGQVQESSVEDVLAELNQLVGLEAVKHLVKELRAFIDIQQQRQQMHLRTEPLVMHMIFRGNPGTGKTTVARIIGQLFKEMNVLPKGHSIEVERADLVGEYIGHTAQRTKEQVKKALGGILFIDEAYSLARGGEKDFGKEAIDVLVKAMEDHKDDFILILAGYRDEMDWFLLTNPGLRSRFPIHIDFPDYTVDELLGISDLMLEKREYSLTPGAKVELRKLVNNKLIYGHEHSGNARLVRNIIEKAIRRQAVRLVNHHNLGRKELMRITPEDLREAVKNDS